VAPYAERAMLFERHENDGGVSIECVSPALSELLEGGGVNVLIVRVSPAPSELS